MLEIKILLFRFAQAFNNDPNCAGVVDDNNSGCANTQTVFPQVQADDNALRTFLMFVFGILGAVAIIIIMISAIKFATSGGDPQATTKARQTIIYALVGLVVAIAAEAAVILLLGRI